MAIYKSESIQDEKLFVTTHAYWKLYKAFKGLKKEKGRFIHVIGSPGTGKSSNIYHALANLDLEVYEPILLLDDVNESSKKVFKKIFDNIKKDFQVETPNEIYRKASEFDVVLFADKILDSEYIQEDKIGLSKWIENRKIKSVPLYLMFAHLPICVQRFM